jgi:low affinity Fe/Cu permease
MRPNGSRSFFTRFTKGTSKATGKPLAFTLAVGLIVTWAVSGPIFGFSDTWQLAINTTTTIVTFLMVFLIQSTQNRDSEAIQIKLDELIRATEGAHTALLDLEELEESELDEMRDCYEELAERAREEMRDGKPDTRVLETDAVSRLEDGANPSRGAGAHARDGDTPATPPPRTGRGSVPAGRRSPSRPPRGTAGE